MLNPKRDAELRELEKNLGISFLNQALLNQALTHSSYPYELRRHDILDNERLEFLGDAVLKLVVSEDLYHKFPKKPEGDLTKIRASAISDETLSKIGRNKHLGQYLLMGASEKKSGGRSRKSNLANTLEALIGALYIDAGLGKSRDFILALLGEEIEKMSREGYIRDFKSALQEFVQKKKWGLPSYRVVKETGPRHKKQFLMHVKIKNRVYGFGKGYAKKDAEQKAAQEALKKLKKEDADEKKKPQKTKGSKTVIDKVKSLMRFG